MRLPRSPRPRRGLSLLEVIIAMAIFLMSLIAISRLVGMAGDRAFDVEQQSEASRLCRSKLNEVAAGVVPLSSVGETPFEEDESWQWALECEQQGSIPNLWTVRVTVSRSRGDGARVQATMSQFILDPAARGSTQDAPTPAGTDTSTTGTGTTGTGSTTTGGR